MKLPNDIVREKVVIYPREDKPFDWNVKEANRKIKECQEKALQTAKRLGFSKDSHKSEIFDVHYVCGFTDRPMNQKNIENTREMLSMASAAGRPASYSYIVRDKKRKCATVKIWQFGYLEEVETLPVLEKHELNLFDTKVLLKHKPHGLSFEDPEGFSRFYAFNLPNNELKPGYYAVQNKDYLEVLANRPHIPNKQESKKIRQEKAKNKN